MAAIECLHPAGSSPEIPSPAARSGRQAFWDLERWLYGGDSGTWGLQAIEVEEERRGREMLRLLLQGHIDVRGEGDVGEALWVVPPDDPGQELLYTHKRIHTRGLVTIFGTVKVARVAYGKPGHASIHPLDAGLQLPARSYSYEIQRRLVKSAVQGPFDEALEAVRESTGIVIPKRSAEQIVVDASADLGVATSRRRVSVFRPVV